MEEFLWVEMGVSYCVFNCGKECGLLGGNWKRKVERQYRVPIYCCNPLLDCFLCDSRSLLLAVLCLFWPYMGPRGPN